MNNMQLMQKFMCQHLEENCNKKCPVIHLFAEVRTSAAVVVFDGITSNGAEYMPAIIFNKIKVVD